MSLINNSKFVISKFLISATNLLFLIILICFIQKSNLSLSYKNVTKSKNLRKLLNNNWATSLIHFGSEYTYYCTSVKTSNDDLIFESVEEEAMERYFYALIFHSKIQNSQSIPYFRE